MLEEGDEAPRFDLPAVHEGEREEVALGEYLDKNVIILAFYPGDFNPGGADGETGLDDLDLFTMQKDVSILAVSGDSIFSHEAFADEYDLHIPLLADVDGDVASAYGVASDADTHQTRRAAFVIDHTGTVEYAWVAEDVDDLPDVDELREAVEGVGSDETARSRYRVGNARYLEGRRAFTSAMKAYEDREWMMARGDFTQACEEFDTAREEFNTAIRFAETDEERVYYERAEQKAEALWRAADWLGDSANAFASGEGAEAERLRQDAETPLETARDIHEPPDPDDFPPEEDPAEQGEDDIADDTSVLPADDGEEPDTTLELDESATADDASEEDTTTDDASPAAGESWGADTPGTAETDETTESGDTSAQAGRDEAATADDGSAEAASGDDEQEEASIDDDELEEIAAELEQQTAAAQERADEADDGNDSVISDEIAVEDEADAATDGHDTTNEEHVEDDLDEDDIELDLTDPTEGEDEEADEDEEDDREDISDEDLGGGGDHGVPDSL